MKKFILAIFFITLTFVLPAKAADNILVASSDKALWIIENIPPKSDQPDTDKKDVHSFKVYVRKADGEFKHATEEPLDGVPAAIDAVDTRLKIFLKKPAQYIILSTDSANMPHGDFPEQFVDKASDDIQAICTADKFGPENQPATIVAFIAPAAATTKPASQPGTKPEDSIKALAKELAPKSTTIPTADLNIIAYQQGKWSHIKTIKNSGFVYRPSNATDNSTEQKISMLCSGEKLLVMVAGREQKLLHIFDGKNWSSEELDMELPLGLVKANDFLGIVSAEKSQDLMQPGWTAKIYRLFGPDGGYIINKDSREFVFDKSPVHVARVGNSVGVIWGTDRTNYKLTVCEVNGNVIKTQPISILTKEKPPYTIHDIQTYYTYGILGVILVTLLVGRVKPDTRPFAFPVTAKPAGLGKRLVAFVIDFIPFMMAASLVTRIFVPEAKNIQFPASMDLALFDEIVAEIPVELGFIVFGAITIWVVYCCVMEWKFGWTLGKRAMKLTVITDPSRELTFRQCILRNAMKLIELMMVVLWPILVVLLLINPLHLRVGDIIAKTFVCDASAPPVKLDTDQA